MRARHLAALLLATVLLLLILRSCQDDPVVDARSGVITATLREYQITPSRVRVRAGAVTLIARNDGRLNHNLRVELPREDPATPERVIDGTPTAQPTTTVRKTVRLTPGRYRLACTIANHDDLGMWAELEVVR